MYEVFNSKQQKMTLKSGQKGKLLTYVSNSSESMGKLEMQAWEETGFHHQHPSSTTQPRYATASVLLEHLPVNYHQALTNASVKSLTTLSLLRIISNCPELLAPLPSKT